MTRKKIALIGAGQIGGTMALLATERKLGDIVLFDAFDGVAKGKALDLNQLASFNMGGTSLMGSGDYKDISDADVCIITAGFPRKPGMSRDDLLGKNLDVIKQVAQGIKEYAPNAFVIVVTNPVDVMVSAFHHLSNFNHKKIVGMAGVLDSARFSTFLAWELGISPDDIRTTVLGGHGDDMVPVPHFCSVNGIPLTSLIETGMISQSRLTEIIERTRKGGGEIVGLLGNGSAFYTPAISALEMAECYLFGKRKILPCASYLNGEYGVNGLFVGVPTLLGAGGVEKIIELPLMSEQKNQFEKSVASVQKVDDEMKRILG